MTWTADKLEKIPEAYRDFLTVLKPVVDSKEPGVILRFTGIPFVMIQNALQTKYDYSAEEFREMANRLKAQGWVHEDQLSFFVPTAQGESIIRAMAGAEEAFGHRIPPLPSFSE